jgi:hypothetical protein
MAHHLQVHMQEVLRASSEHGRAAHTRPRAPLPNLNYGLKLLARRVAPHLTPWIDNKKIEFWGIAQALPPG